MARIERQDIYPFKTPISLSDYFIGTDSQNSNRTKNFRVGDFTGFLNTLGLPNGLIKGEVVWDEQFRFLHTALEGVIDNNTYTALAGTVSGSNSDATNPRTDTIVFDALGNVSVQQGVASATPVEPLVLDPLTTSKLSTYNLAALSTQPTGITKNLMYSEDAGTGGGEYNVTATGAGINLANPANPNSGTVSISLNGISSVGSFVTMAPGSSQTVQSFTNIHLYLNNSVQWTESSRIKVAFFNNGVQISSFVSIRNNHYGLVSNVIGQYQSIILPKDDFEFRGNTWDQVQFQFDKLPVGLIYLDTFNMLGGIENPPRFGSTKAISDMPDSYIGKAGYIAQINDSETGWDFIPFSTTSTPNLQQVTDVGAVTTNAITVQNAIISNNANALSVGEGAGNNAGTLASNFGTSAGANNTGSNVDNFGAFSGLNNTGSSTVNIGISAGVSNTGTDVVNVGNLAGAVNSGSSSVNIGRLAGRNNSGQSSTNIGREAGFSNTGDNAINIGALSGRTNSFDDTISIGNNSLPTQEDQIVFTTSSQSLRLNKFGNSQFNVPVNDGDLVIISSSWNATTNTPTLANTDTNKTGVERLVTVAGTQDFGAGGITFAVGDIISNGDGIWYKKVNNTQTNNTWNIATGSSGVDTGNQSILQSGNILHSGDVFVNAIRPEAGLTGGILNRNAGNLFVRGNQGLNLQYTNASEGFVRITSESQIIAYDVDPVMWNVSAGRDYTDTIAEADPLLLVGIEINDDVLINVAQKPNTTYAALRLNPTFQAGTSLEKAFSIISERGHVVIKEGNLRVDGIVGSKGFTVATLPAGVVGDTAHVTDATTPSYLGTLTGGGAVTCPVFFNGSIWVSS
jgi:hypothetical protein